MRKTLLYSLVLSVLFFSCKKNNDEPNPGLNLGNGVFILNQGNFTAGNASLSYFQNSGSILYNDLFYSVNGVPLGDVAQSITINGSTSYIVVNNSGFIYAINSKTVEYQAKITGFTSPRYMTIVSQNKAYVSDLYSTSIAIVDISSNQVAGSVEVGRSTEEMELIGDEVFAANWSGYGQAVSLIAGRIEICHLERQCSRRSESWLRIANSRQRQIPEETICM